MRTLVATRDPNDVPAQLVGLLDDLCRRADCPASEPELRAALADLSPAEEQQLPALAVGRPPAKPLGPRAWVEILRGLPPKVASARESGGYYTLLAERDALAAQLAARPQAAPTMSTGSQLASLSAPTELPPAPARPAPATADSSDALPSPPPAAPQARRPRPAKQAAPVVAGAAPPTAKVRAPAEAKARAQQLLGLFAYHRDAPLVAKALSLSLAELEAELDALKLRRRAFALTRGSDIDLPAAIPASPGKSGPPLRRKKMSAEPKAPARTEQEEERAELLAALSQVGPRRAALRARLGSGSAALSDAALLTRFRAAGLEREFGQRERDLIRALLARHRGALQPIADELGLPPAELAAVARERGLWRELESTRDHYRREARRKQWPQERLAQLLRQRGYLEDLGILTELEKETQVRLQVLVKELAARTGSPVPLAKLSRELGLPPADTRAVAQQFGLSVKS